MTPCDLKAQGVIRNKLKAYELWIEAAKIGNPQAEDSLDLLCKESPWVCK
jgi:TPR repeat protein